MAPLYINSLQYVSKYRVSKLEQANIQRNLGGCGMTYVDY